MVDGKVCNAATDTKSTIRWYICNNLTKSKEVDKNALQFGLSILHARIRLFESILHIAYKFTIRKCKVHIVKQRKVEIQKEFRNKLGLIVDVPKAGLGNTNDGNTSRRFFNDPKLAAEITCVDITLFTG